jgi:hypothetical protein
VSAALSAIGLELDAARVAVAAILDAYLQARE